MWPSSPARSGQPVPGSYLFSKHSTYLVQSWLGKGTFGKVAKCTRKTDMKTVAIKMIKNEYKVQAAAEVSALFKLKSLDPDKCNIVRWYQSFTDMRHICLEFEHLDQSLFDFMQGRNSQPLLLKEIRPIVQQVASALDHLKTVGLVHADIKLGNIMLVNHVQDPYSVKVIDFSLGCDVSGAKVGSYIQSRAYRSPEIILGLPFTEAIDIWSLGCVAAVLYLGTLLYPGNCEYEMMKYIVETQGQPPDSLLNSGLKTRRFFQRKNDATTSHWKLKSLKRYQKETGISATESRKVKLRSLDDLLHVRLANPMISPDGAVEMTDLQMFVELIKGMLQLDAAERITPSQVLEYQFISMNHMVHLSTASSHVKSCFQLMDVCKKGLTSNSGKAVCGSLQQLSSTTKQPERQRCPPHLFCHCCSPAPPPPPPPLSPLSRASPPLPPSPSAQSSGPSQPPFVKKHPCTCTCTVTSVKTVKKRKLNNDIDVKDSCLGSGGCIRLHPPTAAAGIHLGTSRSTLL